MGKKIVENHKIIPEEKDKNIVEELIQQQNITSEFSLKKKHLSESLFLQMQPVI